MAEAILPVALIAQGASTLLTSQGQASAIKIESQYRANQFAMNARLADIRAKDAEERGKEDAKNYKLQVKRLIGRQRAALAAQGVDPDTGTGLDIQLETAEFGALDANTILNNAFREAAGYRIEAIDNRGQASFTKLAGKNQARSSLVTGGIKAVSDFGIGVYRNDLGFDDFGLGGIK